MRALLVFVLGGAIVGCESMQSAGVALEPRPALPGDSTQQEAFALVARVAERRGLTPFEPKDRADEGWVECRGKGSLILCGKVNEGEVQFRLLQWIRFSSEADTLRRELVDSLRVRCGEPFVRECEWQLAAAPKRSGCLPRAQTDNR